MGGDKSAGKLNKVDQKIRGDKIFKEVQNAYSRAGLYTSSAEIKEIENQKRAAAQAAAFAQSEAEAKNQAEVKQRMNIFKTAGGSEGEEVYSTGKKRKLFSN